MKTGRILAFRDSSAHDVEIGPDGAPCAFRIWTSGANPTDHGKHIFSERSARLLLTEQATRGNLYSIDVDHLSLNKESPPEARKAVGWHRLEVRDGDLWAVDVKWTDIARSGLTKDPPEWRYFSPAYDVDSGGEVTSYLNTALTNNPATWSVTALATKGNSMKYEAIIADLMGDDPDKKAKAIAALAAAFPEGEPDGDEKKKDNDSDGDNDGDTKATKAAEDDADKKAAEDDADKKAAISATRSLASTVTELQGTVDGLLKEKEEGERTAVLASRPDLPEKLVKTLREMPLPMMKATIEGIPAAQKVDPAAASKVQATRGAAGQVPGGDFQVRASRLPQAEHEELVARMGGTPKPASVHWDKDKSSDLVFPLMSKEQARRVLAARKETV
jgi:phage I-like protein